ncbi:MAG: hypothetical protein ACLTW9_00005, partial [Enterocloster sp.]
GIPGAWWLSSGMRISLARRNRFRRPWRMKTDFYLIRGLRISSYFAVELSKRTVTPNKSAISKCDRVDVTAHLLPRKTGYAFWILRR